MFKYILLSILTIGMPLFSMERITQFKSDIEVFQDASMHVKETITAFAGGFKIRHGIVREFPTDYFDKWGNRYRVDFEIISVKRNGNIEPYIIKNYANGKGMYIGSRHVLLQPGMYTYEIIYRTRWQLGFFKNHDELYWSVTGNSSRFPIEKAIAHIKLPFPIDTVKLEGYSGAMGERKKDFAIDNKTLTIETTAPLQPREGLTVVAAWPKGFINQPSSFAYKWRFFKDNFGLFLMLLISLLVVAWYLALIILKIKNKKEYTVIPRFYPPDDLSPAAVRYIQTMKYETIQFASELVNMAVHGYITIEPQKKGFFNRKREYLFHKVIPQPKEEGELHERYQKWIKRLFNKSFIYETKGSDSTNLQGISESLSTFLYVNYAHLYDDKNGYKLFGFLFSFIPLFFVFFFNDFFGGSVVFLIIIGIVLLIINMVSIPFIGHYTDKGERLKAEIEGFKLYLKTAEVERMKIIGTPPTKTPALYEKYLPYAIALDVEEEWTKQFTPVFAALAKEGHAYQPQWYGVDYAHGFRFDPSFASSVSSDLSQSLHSVTISSSSSAPGSDSGSGGGGSSGGGGGGGGVGGW